MLSKDSLKSLSKNSFEASLLTHGLQNGSNVRRTRSHGPHTALHIVNMTWSKNIKNIVVIIFKGKESSPNAIMQYCNVLSLSFTTLSFVVFVFCCFCLLLSLSFRVFVFYCIFYGAQKVPNEDIQNILSGFLFTGIVYTRADRATSAIKSKSF